MSIGKAMKPEGQQKEPSKRKCLLPLPPFFLPGDVEPLPEKPLAVGVMLTSVAKYLDSVACPDFGGFTLTEEQRKNERITWANAALRELWNWIAAHAVDGDSTAQAKVFESALGITSSFLVCARKKLPVIVKRAEMSNLIPGYISRDKCCQESMESLCHEIGQGTKFPFPLEAPGVKGKKQKAKLSTSQHDLVGRLFKYLEETRLLGSWNSLVSLHEIEKQKALGFFVHPLIEAMLELPPLSPESWNQWHKIGRRVIEAHTGGDPAQHPAFQPGGFFASLGVLNKRGERQIWKRLGEAWKLRAESMTVLPTDSLHRKEYSRG